MQLKRASDPCRFCRGIFIYRNMKKCSSCCEDKGTSQFSFHNSSKDGLHTKCKECVRKKVCPELPPSPLAKTCSVCNEYKLAVNYRYKKNGKWALTSQCNQCISEKHKINSLIKKTPKNDIKICIQCKTGYDIIFYTKDSYKKDGLRPECNYCKKANRLLRRNRELEMGKLYYQNNKEKLVEAARIYRLNNPETYRQTSIRSNKKYREENRDKFNASVKKCYTKYKSKYFATQYEKIRTTPILKLKTSIRSLLSSTFKRACNGTFKKSKRSSDILMCNMEDLLLHMQKQFLSWMSWNNYGKCPNNSYMCSWEMDHIIPTNYAKTEEEIYLLNHWSNFQPMCGVLNRGKSDEIFPCTNLELRITFWKDYYEFV